MVEYGVNTNNKFVFLDGDEGSDVEDPQELIRRAEIAQKKDERTATQKKAEKLAAAKAKKEAIAEAAVKAAQREEAAKKAAHGKENRPEGGGERGGRGRGRGGERGGGGFRGAGGERRGGRGGGPGGEHGAGGEAFADRFGEGGGRGRGGPRGGRGGPRPPFRGRGGNHQPGSGGEDGAPQHRPEVTFNENQENINVNGGEENGPRGGFRGGRGGRGRGDFGARPRIGYAGRGGGRQFDRQSGSDKTGVKAVDKKDGHGRGNWGDNADEIAGETEPVPAGEGEEVVEKAPPPPREKTDEEKAREAEEEALAKLKTLAEFKAELDSKREQPKFNIRRGGEDETSFGKLVKIEKKNEGEEQREETIVVKKEPRSKPLEIDIHFTDSGARGQNSREDRPPRGDRPFRGSRGGPRGGEGGGRGRGGPRGGPGGSGGESRGGGNFRGGAHQSHFEVSAEAFPALG